jgi:hypothetical protein
MASLILTCVTAVGALFAALGAWWSAAATKWAARGQLFASLLRDYSSPDMGESLVLLGDLRDRKNKDADSFNTYVRDWLKLRKDPIAAIVRDLHGESGHPKVYIQNVQRAHKVDEARRQVTHYFMGALDLYQNKKCIDKKFLEIVCRQDGFNLLYAVAEHLEKALAEEGGWPYDKRSFDTLLAPIQA